MSLEMKHHAMVVFLLSSVGLILACGLSFSSPQPAPGVDPTLAVLQLQGTAMVLQLTQSAMNAQQPIQPADSPTAAPTPTETAGPLMPFQMGTIELTYGEKASSYPRKNQSTLFGFQGTKGDRVVILVESSAARPNDPSCKGKTGAVSFILRVLGSAVPGVSEGGSLSALRDYELPRTTAYYIEVSCAGSGCNAYCIAADATVQKQ
jgi:hypothetical protein